MAIKFLAMIALLLAFNLKGQDDMMHNAAHSNIKITVVYDNMILDPSLTAEWGFGCVIQTEADTILFDTGSNGQVLLSNLQKLNIDPQSIQSVLISHNHRDHQGGLLDFLAVNSQVTVFIPNASPMELEKDIHATGAQAVRVDSFQPVGKMIYSSGELKDYVPEQSLVVRSSAGLVVITGCAHPGIANIIEHVKTLFPNEILHLVMGGFHLKSESTQNINRIVKRFQRLGVQRVAPSHCTGEEAVAIFAQEYRDGFIKSGVGRKIYIPDLPFNK